MPKPNVHGLPNHLRKDDKGYFLDYFIEEGGVKKRKRVRIGQVPAVQARKVLVQHLQDIVDHKFLADERREITFNEAADSFLTYSEGRRKTFYNDARMVGKLKAFFGNRTLKSLNADYVEAYLNLRRREGHGQRPGEPIKGSTLNRELSCLKCIVRRAVLNNLLDKNPIAGVRKFKEESRDRTLTPEEYQGLLQHASRHLRAMIELAYWTGMRRGEIFGLRWDQVDLKNKVINLEAADTKTQEKREVPLNETLIGVFHRVPKTIGSLYVFTFKGHPLKSVKTTFGNACRKAGIKDFKFHDLRHCAVTNLRKAGVGDTVIMSISGHKTYAMFKRYNRIDRQDRIDALQRVERLNDTGMTTVKDTKSAK